MTRSLLHRFVGGTRQVLVLQLIVSVTAVGLAGWTMGVTNDLIRERERLRTRITQLEETLVAHDVVVPSTATVVDAAAPQRTRDAYPPSVTLPTEQTPDAPAATTETPAPAETQEPSFNPGQIIGDLFTPPPPLRTIVLHARSAADARVAQVIAQDLQRTGDIRVGVVVMTARDQRQSGYSYFDGRQSRPAADLMQRFHDIARRNEVAAWSAQLRGVALPAQGEFATDRMDIVLPPLPRPQIDRLDPAITNRDPQLEQQTPPPVIR
jgi:hypothetical protein